MAENKERSDLFNLTFSQNKRRFEDLEREREDEEIELSLGLSLNGRFGVDPNRPDNASLVRSSSVSNFALGGRDEVAAAETAAGLGRTLSMPAVTEEELRRRRDEQMVRRMEAKRKRVEKMMSEKMKGGGNGRIRERHVAVGGSQGSVSSGGSESDAPPIYQAGINIPVEIRSSGSVQSQQDEPKLTLSIEKTNINNPSIKPTNEANTTMNSMMVDMPSVSTRGVGPSGRRVEGFLYRYTKGEEVKIVCVCHGSFLSPAEFVKHAGGEDVSHPLKHIVINSSAVM